MRRCMRTRSLLAVCSVGFALSATFSPTAVPRSPTHDERWVTLDGVRGIGHIDWTCSAGKARTRFVNSGLTTSRVRVFRRSVELETDVKFLPPRAAIEIHFGQLVQRWRVQPISESQPEPVTFRVRPRGPPRD